MVTGFEPLDFLQGTVMAVRQLEFGRAVVENQYHGRGHGRSSRHGDNEDSRRRQPGRGHALWRAVTADLFGDVCAKTVILASVLTALMLRMGGP